MLLGMKRCLEDIRLQSLLVEVHDDDGWVDKYLLGRGFRLFKQNAIPGHPDIVNKIFWRNGF